MAELKYISVERLYPHPDNPRKELGDLTELADSIKANGIYQNLTVIPMPHEWVVEHGKTGYTVIIGHRRLAAAKQAGLTEVPCVVTDMTPKEQMQTMLLENMQRSDLTVYEQAQGFQMMLDLGSTVEEIAEKSGFSATTVRRRVKMMELDQAKLKEVSSRQLSIGDFDTLAQIEDIKERNKVLESIGTHNFNQNVNYALSKQKEKHNLPLIKKWLKEVGAKALKDSERYGGKFESYDGRYSISVSKWGESGSEPPKVGKTPIYYVLDRYGSLYLYKKRERAKPEKKSPEELARTKAVNEAWHKLDADANMAYELRKQFVENLTFTSKNHLAILKGALLGAVYGEICYIGSDRTAISKILGIDPNSYGRSRDEKVAAELGNLNDKDIPALAYTLFGDGEKEKCVEYDYHSNFPKYKLNGKLNLIYSWLMTLGYGMSTEEMQLLNGEHESYHAAEKFQIEDDGGEGE